MPTDSPIDTGPSMEGDLRQRVDDLEELVRWLAVPFGDNRPILPPRNEHGQDLPANVRLAATYASVVPDRRPFCTEERCAEYAEPGYRWCPEHLGMSVVRVR